MKIQILFLILTISILSCNKLQEKETYYSLKIINNSIHTIKLKPFDFHYINGTDSTILQPGGEELIWEFSDRGEGAPLVDDNLFRLDSIRVTYNDTLSVYHSCNRYTMNRDLRKINSYTGGEKQVNKKNVLFAYDYIYTFTNADFEEAKTK